MNTPYESRKGSEFYDGYGGYRGGLRGYGNNLTSCDPHHPHDYSFTDDADPCHFKHPPSGTSPHGFPFNTVPAYQVHSGLAQIAEHFGEEYRTGAGYHAGPGHHTEAGCHIRGGCSDGLMSSPYVYNKGSTCLCVGARTKICADRIDMERSYLSGTCGGPGLTEYTDLAEIQRRHGGPRWKQVTNFSRY